MIRTACGVVPANRREVSAHVIASSNTSRESETLPALRCHGDQISFNRKGYAKPVKMRIGNSCIKDPEKRQHAS